ncbi:MAG: HlyD family type I secretion periplasmic adaptor subunit [Gammaproteobacteria bacterium]
MESTNKSPVGPAPTSKTETDATFVEFLPDADELERRPLPRTARLTLYVLLTMLLCFLSWAIVFDLDRVVVARGRLVTPLPNIVIQPLETSIIQSLDVRIGQVVKKSEPLATLDPTFAEADQSQLRTRLQSLHTESQRLEAELAGQPTSGGGKADADAQLQAQLAAEREAYYEAQLAKMEEIVAGLHAAIETNDRDQKLLAGRVKSLQQIEAMQEELVARRVGAQVALLEAQERRLGVEREMQLVRNRAQELQRELAAAEAEKVAFVKGWRQKTMEDLLSTMRDREAVSEQLQKANKRQKLVTLTSPTDAVVLDIAKRSQGSVVKEAEPLFTLVPLDAELEAEVQIDSADVGYAKVGDVAHLKLDAYPFQRHGALPARVSTISEDAFRRESAADPSSLRPGMDAFFLSRIELDKPLQLRNLPEHARLLPGMTLTAQIVVGKRSVISYLLWPLTRTLDEALREP